MTAPSPTQKKKKPREFGSYKKSPRQLSPMVKQGLIGVTIMVVLSLVITGIYYGSRIESKQITDVVATGGETVAHAEIERRAKTILNETYFRLIPKRFTWTYPQEIIRGVTEQIDKVKAAELSLVGQTLRISFTEYEPFALWCNTGDTECFYINPAGYAFTEAPQLTGGAFLRFADIARPPEKDVTAFPAGFVAESTRFAELIEANFGWFVSRVVKGERQDVEYQLAGGGALKTSRDYTTEETLENLQTILEADEFTELAPGNFQYVDLRFGNKVYVNDTDPALLASSTATSTATSTLETQESEL